MSKSERSRENYLGNHPPKSGIQSLRSAIKWKVTTFNPPDGDEDKKMRLARLVISGEVLPNFLACPHSAAAAAAAVSKRHLC